MLGIRDPATLRQCVNRRKQSGQFVVCKHIYFLWLRIAKIPFRKDIGFTAAKVHVLREQADGACPALHALCTAIVSKHP